MQEVWFHYHIAPKHLDSLKQVAHQEPVILRFGIAKKTGHHRCKCISCIQFCWCIELMKAGSFISPRIWGPSNTPALIFSSVMAQNFTHRYSKQSASLSSVFKSCFTKPSVICSGGRRTFSGFTNGSYLIFFSPTTNSVRLGQSCFTQWSSFARLSHKQRKQGYFVYPPRCPRSIHTIFKYLQIFQLCSEYFNFSGTCFMLS